MLIQNEDINSKVGFYGKFGFKDLKENHQNPKYIACAAKAYGKQTHKNELLADHTVPHDFQKLFAAAKNWVDSRPDCIGFFKGTFYSENVDEMVKVPFMRTFFCSWSRREI